MKREVCVSPEEFVRTDQDGYNSAMTWHLMADNVDLIAKRAVRLADTISSHSFVTSSRPVLL